MMLRKRLIPVAALVVAIGTSAAGAATAAETGSGTKAGGTDKSQKPVNCKVLLPGGGIIKKDPGLGKAPAIADKDAAIKAAKAAAEDQAGGDQAAGKGGGKPPVAECKNPGKPGKPGKPVKVMSLDTIASELGVSKAALVQALTQTKQWIVASPTKPAVGAFEQHLADLLHVPVAKVASVFGSEVRIAVNPGS
jgi:hypothetical protein